MKVLATPPKTSRLPSAPAPAASAGLPQDVFESASQIRDHKSPATAEAQRQAIKTLKAIQVLSLSPAIKAAAAVAVTCVGPTALAHLTSAPTALAVAEHLLHLGPWFIGFEAVRAAAQAAIPAMAIRDIKETGHISPWVHKTSHVFSKAEKAVGHVTGVLAYPFKASTTWLRQQFIVVPPGRLWE